MHNACMARHPRLCIPMVPHLVLQRSRHAVFSAADDYGNYLERLANAASRRAVAIHAYAILPTAVYLLLTPETCAGLSSLMQELARCTSRGHVSRAGAAEAVWDGRFRTALVQPDAWLLRASCAVESAPAAENVASSADWPWSSLSHHAGRLHRHWLRDAAAWWALGNTPYAREAAYRALFEASDAAAQWPLFKAAALAGRAVGDADFIARCEADVGRKLGARPRGRPRQSVPN